MATLCVLMALTSCSTEKFVKRQLAKHPEWGTYTDTTLVHDTLTLKESVHDSVFVLNLTDSTDTMTMENDTVRVEITRWKDRLQVRTVVKERPVPYVQQRVVNNSVQVPQPPKSFIQRSLDMLGRWALIILVGWLLWYLLRNMRPPGGGRPTLVC